MQKKKKKATAIHTNDQWQIDNIVIFYLCIVADGDSWLLSKENINTTECRKTDQV